MKRKIATTIGCVALTLAAFAGAPVQGAGGQGVLSVAQAAVTKSLDGGAAGGGNVSGAGDRLGGLLANFGVPVLIALAGFFLIGALASRNIGTSVGIVLITLIGLIFLLSPESIEGLAKGIANTVF